MRKICRGEPRNLVNWPAEFGKICCRKLWSLIIVFTSMVHNYTLLNLLLLFTAISVSDE